MILEVADIRVKEGSQTEFEKAVQVALNSIFPKLHKLSLWRMKTELPPMSIWKIGAMVCAIPLNMFSNIWIFWLPNP